MEIDRELLGKTISNLRGNLTLPEHDLVLRHVSKKNLQFDMEGVSYFAQED